MITLGKAIYSILSSDAVITGYTGTRIYPLIAPENTVSPLIVFERNSTPEDTKDNNTLYQTNVTINVIDDDYTNGVNICTAVQNALEHYKGTIEGIIIRNISLYRIEEGFGKDGYIQTMTFTVLSV